MRGEILLPSIAEQGKNHRLHMNILGALVVVFVWCQLSVGAASADPSGEIDVTVQIEDVGNLTVGFADVVNGYQFRNSSGTTVFHVSALSGDIATASIRVSWSDDRTDEARTAFQIGLSASNLVSTIQRPDGAGVYAISAQNLSVLSIDGVNTTAPITLLNQQSVFSSGATSAPGSGTIDIVLKLVIPPSSYPTTYTTTLQLNVLPAEGGI